MAFGSSQVQWAQAKHEGGRSGRLRGEAGAGARLLTFSGIAVIALALAAAAVLPTALVLPVLSVILIVCAAAAALYAWVRPARSQTITPWDVSGVLAFFGIAAALLSDPEQVLPLIEQAQARR